jgi:ABC-type glycerol-3-phosphate transport system substrate-binding protein
MCKPRSIVFLLFAIFAAACTRQEPRGPSASGRQLNQAVVMYAAGDVIATGDSGAAVVEIGDVLSKGQSVKTGALSECELQLGDRTAIRIEENAVVCLDDIVREPGEMNIGIRAVIGTVLCKVDKLSGNDRFRVRTPSAVCSVRGTEFSVTVSENNDTLLAVKQGRVAILPASLDMEKLAAELKTGDPEVEAALAELGESELIVADAEEAVVTGAASRQVEEILKDVENGIKAVSGEGEPSAAEKETFKAVVRKAAADIRSSMKTPKPMKEERIKALERIEDLKRRKPPAKETEASPPEVGMGGDERASGEAGVELVIWVREIDAGSPLQAYMSALENDFKRKNPDIHVMWQAFKPETYDNEIRMALESDRGPDVFQTYGGESLRRYADAGKLLDVTEELSPSIAARSVMSFNGRLYGAAPVFSVAGLYFNEGIFRKLRLNAPANVGEMEKAASVLKAEGIQPFACGAGDRWPVLAMYMYLANRFGGDAFERVKERRMRFTADPFQRAGQKLKEWAEKGFFGDAPLQETYPAATALIKTGSAGMMVSGSWLCKDFSDRSRADQAIGFRPFPVIIGGMGEIGDVMGMTEIGFSAREQAERKRGAVLRFFEYSMSPEACRADPGLVYSNPGAKTVPGCTAEANALLARAKTVQFYWDQDLPPVVREPVMGTISSFLSPESNVRDALAGLEELLAENMGRVR